MSDSYSPRWWAVFGEVDPARTAADVEFLERVLPLPAFRWVLDVHNRSFFEARQGTRGLRPGIIERSTVQEGRRRCELDYGDGTVDVFEWQLYRPDTLQELAGRHGLAHVLTAGTDDLPSMQLVFERSA